MQYQTKLSAFVDMLNEMRYGKLTPTSIAKFKALSRELKFSDGIKATELYGSSFYVRSTIYIPTGTRVVRMLTDQMTNKTKVWVDLLISMSQVMVEP